MAVNAQTDMAENKTDVMMKDQVLEPMLHSKKTGQWLVTNES